MNAPMELEQWKSIPGFEGAYEISSFGQIISLARTVFGKKKQTVRSSVVKVASNGKGYLAARLWKNGKEKSEYVHRLVLLAFSGCAPLGNEACHNNGNRADNRLSNLRWDSKKNNHADKVKHGTLLNGEKARHAKLTADKVLSIRESLAAGIEQEVLAQSFGVSQTTISEIYLRKTWKHI